MQSLYPHIKSIAKTLWRLPAKTVMWWHNSHRYVIMDHGDSSITFSQSLFRLIKKAAEETDALPKVFVFYVPDTKCYGFCVNPSIEQPTQLADIQYYSKYKFIGFETLNPTVA